MLRIPNRNSALASLLVLLTAGCVLATGNEDWRHVEALRPGDRIGVVRMDMKRVEGEFETATSGELVVKSDKTIVIAKDDVVRVYKRPALRRMTRALIGAGIGAAAGGVIAATAGRRFSNEGNDNLAAPAAVTGGIALGALLGAASGGGDVTIYRRTGSIK